MYAVVEIQGSQFKVSKNQKLYVNRLKGKEGTKVSFDNVLLVDEDGKVKVGMPKVSGAVVEAKIVSHQKGVVSEKYIKNNHSSSPQASILITPSASILQNAI